MNENLFGKRLQKLMDEHDLKAADVAQLSKKYDDTGKGLSKANLSQWLNGVYVPKSKGIYLLSKIFNVNPNYLMGNTDDPSYDHEELTQQVITCDLINKCFGKQAYELVKMYLSLNAAGKDAAFERVQELTQLEKYTDRDKKKDAV
jgi:hypothetical protein